MSFRFGKILIAGVLAVLLLVTSCAKAPSQFDQAQQESTARGAAAVVKESTSGGSFNRFFPPSGGGYERVYTQEKKGFAEAKLKQDGKVLAMLAISDISNNPAAANKFQDSQTTIKGFPSVEQGATATAVLVNNRYQVKVLSRDADFSASDRQVWLAKFDLDGLAKLK
ncbi:MAG: hypothetical protein EWV49_05525 [Microcystis aeruginosa Ma_QC_Ch_20071001_S25]|jgi:hypothetical protein|uniref:Lipoprotein n=1 Tax=Microcystis aeruginosa Ma_QC_Ch_20071001_S25D TaxID=2486250 RepID=A0A552FUK4_MICAE|nr:MULTISPECIES: hypothetical protein [unclassified Microcystis]MCA2764016.1 hypothetical protein [Microcystis sp. M151S2]TRU50415.1 MAG: hypothetical protein EWV57_10390 [Microcystis aeruginosa Ma_QC_Ch_20071001_S25D]TRU52383.1 MAG: hypothetical protein EWV49_05525 [Microcystis aeruginosa Ma_QC_Ch_20071001_S25]TRU57780.1 MAG: hypothetical protein EWV90_20035 [Microcystis aeruginosa Ma_QC_Ch_20071001_M135]MCA2644164.1 hypothetical protein [Microcystis sp. M087S2]